MFDKQYALRLVIAIPLLIYVFWYASKDTSFHGAVEFLFAIVGIRAIAFALQDLFLPNVKESNE